MASKRRKKSRLENREAQVLEDSATKAHRAAELRSLFDEAGQTQTPTLKSLSAAPVTTSPTPTPSRLGGTQTSTTPIFTQVPTAPRPALRTVISHTPYTPAKRVDLGAREREKKTTWWLGPLLICGAAFMLMIAWFDIQRSNVVAQPVGHPSATLESLTRETRKKVAFYQKQLGHRLNADRVNVEILNARLAPTLDTNDMPKTDPSMMRGVPLMQENYVDQNYGSRNKTEPVSMDHPDARIQYGLQEEQQNAEFDRRVQQEYIREFVENARRDGVNVTLDADANIVNVEPIGGSSNNGRRPGGYSSGVSR